MTRQQEDTLTADRLWSEYARTHRPETRNQIIEQFSRLAYSVANRFARRGAENEDLFQVALMGLVKAVDRFDPNTHHRFSTFATPTILGELRRYFRDHAWSVHVPRGTQELAQQVQRVTPELSAKLGRTPTAEELGNHLNVPAAKIEDVLALPQANRPLSLDGEMERDGDHGTVLEDCLGREDRAMASAVDRVSVSNALSHLAEPLQEIIRMRYLEDQSQRQVARTLGYSQMRVSRLERRALGLLRAQFAVN